MNCGVLRDVFQEILALTNNLWVHRLVYFNKVELNIEHLHAGAILLSLWDTLSTWQRPVTWLPGEDTVLKALFFSGILITKSPSGVHWALWNPRNEAGDCGEPHGGPGTSLLTHQTFTNCKLVNLR